MNQFLHILILLLLAIIIYQDFRYRAISWVALPLLFAAFATNSILTTDLNSFFQSFLFNIGFIIFQLLAVTAYFSLKNRSITNITSNYIGWGDILFFVVAATVFSPVNFIVFYLLSIISTLIFALAYRIAWKNSSAENLPDGSHVPLAGAMALILFVFYSFGNLINEFNFHNDQFILSFVN